MEAVLPQLYPISKIFQKIKAFRLDDGGLYFATQAQTLAEGLNCQLEEFIQLHPDTKLIIVDTLQKVREMGNENYSYSMDYQNITGLKAFSDAHNLAIIIVRHTRKMEAGDSFDMISGTNGLLGCC